jgi:hypothetical protein
MLDDHFSKPWTVMNRSSQKFVGFCIASFLISAIGTEISSGQSSIDRNPLHSIDPLDPTPAAHSNVLRPVAVTASRIESPLSRFSQTRGLPQTQTSQLPPHPTKLQPILSPNPISSNPNSYFGTDQPTPVVVVWLNSDLDEQLLTTDQLKAWIQQLPERDFATAPAPPTGGVRQVSFWQQEATKENTPPTDAATQPATPPLSEELTELKKNLDLIGKRIESREKQITDDKSIDDATRTEFANQLKAATDRYQKAVDDFGSLLKQTEARKNFEASLNRRQEALQAEKKMTPEPPGDGSVDDLKAELRATEESLQKAVDAQGAIREKITERESRISELPELQVSVNKELSEIKKKSDDLKDLPEGPNRILQTLIVDAREISAEVRKQLLVVEGKRQDQLNKIQPLERETLVLRVKRLDAQADLLRKAVDKKLQKQIDDQKLKDSDVLDETITKNTPVLKALAEENIALTRATETLIGNNQKLSKGLDKIREQNNEIDKSYEELKRYIETRGKTASGIRLIEHRRGLISTGASRSRLSELENELQTSRTELFRLKELRDQLSDNDKVLASIASNPAIERLDAPKTDERHRDAMDIAKQLIDSQTDYVDELIEEYDSHIEKISDLQVEHKKLVSKVQDIKAFSDENALWIRSAEPLGLKEIGDCQKGISHFYTGYDWASILNFSAVKQSLKSQFGSRPYDPACLVLLLGTLFVIQRRLRWTHA